MKNNIKIEIIPCLQDNYSYLIIDESKNDACVVDPSEAKPIINFVEIESDKGHDSFLLDVPEFLSALKNFLDKSYTATK